MQPAHKLIPRLAAAAEAKTAAARTATAARRTAAAQIMKGRVTRLETTQQADSTPPSKQQKATAHQHITAEQAAQQIAARQLVTDHASVGVWGEE